MNKKELIKMLELRIERLKKNVLYWDEANKYGNCRITLTMKCGRLAEAEHMLMKIKEMQDEI